VLGRYRAESFFLKKKKFESPVRKIFVWKMHSSAWLPSQTQGDADKGTLGFAIGLATFAVQPMCASSAGGGGPLGGVGISLCLGMALCSGGGCLLDVLVDFVCKLASPARVSYSDQASSHRCCCLGLTQGLPHSASYCKRLATHWSRKRLRLAMAALDCDRCVHRLGAPSIARCNNKSSF